MNNNLLIKESLGLQREMTIKSIDLVEIINMFRQEEGNKVKLYHKNFMVKIRNILNLGIGENAFIESTYLDRKSETRPCYSMTAEGVSLMIDRTTTSDIVPMQKVLEELGGHKKKVVCVDRFETTFFTKLEETLDAMGIGLELQKQVLGKYYIDGFIDGYNLAIEYDEEQHFRNDIKAEDIKRQKAIEDKLGYKFIRLNYKNTDAYNIGLVVRELF